MTVGTLGGIAAGLAEVVGPAHVLEGEAARGFAVDDVCPRWVVAPASVAEVARCLAVASEAGLAVAPGGRGTRRHWGAVPPRLDVVLSLARLDRVLAYEPDDLTMSVQGGTTLSAVQARVRPHGQFLALDPPGGGRSSIGGLVATNASGPYRARYGTMREHLLGLTVVQADGAVVKGGGRVVKNVTGYDVTKLHVGGLGTLGVVVEAHLRLHPLPPAEGTWLFGFAGAEAAVEAATALRDAPVVLSRLELVDAATLGRLGFPPVRGAVAVAVMVASVPEAVRAQGERIAEICRRASGTPGTGTLPDGWWERVADASSPGAVGSALALRIGTRPTDVARALAVVETAAEGLPIRATAELAAGVLHAVAEGAGPPDGALVLERVRAGLAPLAGTCVVEHAPPALKRRIDVWGDVGPALDAMRRLKAELDPRGTLNPGRFVGGI